MLKLHRPEKPAPILACPLDVLVGEASDESLHAKEWEQHLHLQSHTQKKVNKNWSRLLPMTLNILKRVFVKSPLLKASSYPVLVSVQLTHNVLHVFNEAKLKRF